MRRPRYLTFNQNPNCTIISGQNDSNWCHLSQILCWIRTEEANEGSCSKCIHRARAIPPDLHLQWRASPSVTQTYKILLWGNADSEIKVPSTENPEFPLESVEGQKIAQHASPTARVFSFYNWHLPEPVISTHFISKERNVTHTITDVKSCWASTS